MTFIFVGFIVFWFCCFVAVMALEMYDDWKHGD